MHPVHLKNFSYVPMLGVRNSEMRALEELPSHVKDSILPYIFLQPWGVSNHLENTVARLDAAVGARPVIVDLTPKVPSEGKRRPVHDELDLLRNSANGFENWYKFVEGHPNYIPTIQLTDPKEIASQLKHAIELKRGVAVRIHEPLFGSIKAIAQQILVGLCEENLIFVVDFEFKKKDLLLRSAQAVELIKEVQAILPEAVCSVAASTFPSLLAGLDEQDVYERQFHDLVVAHIGKDRMVYADRASVRAEQGGGSGRPAPRIDYPLTDKWIFFREPDHEDKELAYQAAAEAAMLSPRWADLGIWGTHRIKETASGIDGIISPQASTAVRINIHMYRQSNQGPGPSEGEWID